MVLADEERSLPLLRRGERILVPMANPRTQESLFSVAQALLPPGGGEIIVLNVVLADGELSPREVLRQREATDRALGVLEQVLAMARKRHITFRPVVRAARSLAEGIHHAAQEQHARLIVMGWASQGGAAPSQLLESVLVQVRTDLVLLQLTQDVLPRRIGVSLGGRSNLPLMVRVGNTLAEQYEGEVTYLNVMPERYEHQHLAHARQIQMEALSRHTSLVPYRTELLRSDDALAALVERSRSLDLLVVGSVRPGPFRGGGVGTFSALVAQQAHCSVVIVRASSSLDRILPSQAEGLLELGRTVASREEPGETRRDADPQKNSPGHCAPELAGPGLVASGPLPPLPDSGPP